MALTLPRFLRGSPFANKDLSASEVFISWWQRVCSALESHETAQDLILSRLKRCLSHTVPTTIIHALDIGASCTITIDNHSHVYGDGSILAITGSVFTGLANDTSYAFYYDDTTLANTTPTILHTTDIELAQAVKADGRHFLGVILTPSAGSGQTIDGGGVYAMGSNVGGEV